MISRAYHLAAGQAYNVGSKMRANRAPIVIGIAMALLLPKSVIGQEATSSAKPTSATAEWVEIADAPWASLEGAVLSGAGTSPDGRVVLIGGPPFGAPTVWYSDDGVSWKETKPTSADGISDLVSTPSGLLMVRTGVANAVLSWSSSDAVHWGKPTRLKNADIGGVDVSDGAVYLAGGRGAPGKTKPTIWRRAVGGEDWARLPLGQVRKKGYAYDVAPLPGGELLVITSDNSGTPQLHRGSWGGSWTKAELPLPDGVVPLTMSLASVPDGAVLAVSGEESTSLWYSADGEVWEMVVDGQRGFSLVQQDDAVFLLPTMIATTDGRDWCEYGMPSVDKDDQLTGVAELPDGRLVVAGFSAKTNGNRITFRPLAWMAQHSNCTPRGGAVDGYGVVGLISEPQPTTSIEPPMSPDSVPLPDCPMPSLAPAEPATGSDPTATETSPGAPVESVAKPCEAVVADIGTLIAGPHPAIAEIDPALLQQYVYGDDPVELCAEPPAKPAKLFGPAPGVFAGWPSTLSKQDQRLDRETRCLYMVAFAWDRYRNQTPSAVGNEDLAAVAALYGAAVKVTGKSGAKYMDRALRKYEHDEAAPQKKVRVRRKLSGLLNERTRSVKVGSLHQLVHDAVARDLARLLPPKRRGFASAEPVMYDGYSNRGSTTLPTACQHDPVYHSCNGAVANAWLAYEVTGDERWYRLASGLRSLAITKGADVRAFEPSRVTCYLRKNSRQC